MAGAVLVAEVGRRRVAAAVCGGLLAELGAEVVTGAERAGAADVVLLSTDLDPAQRALWECPGDRIVCDITGFGHAGPLAGRALSPPLVEAYAGTVDTTGQRGGKPTPTGAPFVEMETAVYAASAILAALRVRREHGFGQRLDIAVFDVGVNALATFIPLALTGRVATRNGNRHPGSSPWNSYAASDGALVICAPSNDQWARLAAVIGKPELAGDPRFVTGAARLDNVDAIDAEIGAWASARTVAECLTALAASIIPASPIVALEDLHDEPNIVHRGSMAGGKVRSPIRLDDALAKFARPPATEPDESVRPLAGIRVIEIGMNTVGPLAGRQLGALGADVIKVEPPSGDMNRYTPPLREDGASYIYAISNTDKRGVVLDLKQPGDAETLWRLLNGADVLIENLKPGSLTRLGFGAEDVRRRNPRLVYCSVNGFGHDSAYPGRPALDTVVQAMSGAMSATTVDGVPSKSGLSLADQLGGQFGLLAVLAALERRDHTGEGATLDLAMHDCAAWATQLAGKHRCDIEDTPDGYVAVDGDDRAPVLTVQQVLDHPQTRARGLTPHRESADGDEWLVLESPLRLCATPARVGAPMARLGHLDPELAEELGLVR